MSDEDIEKWNTESASKVSDLPMSLSCSSFEVLDPHDPVISRLATLLFRKTNDYVQGEITSGQDHCVLLESLNRMTITKYVDLTNLASNLTKNFHEFNEIFLCHLKHLLDQIDVMSTLVDKMAENVTRLDNHTRKLHERYKELQNNLDNVQ